MPYGLPGSRACGSRHGAVRQHVLHIPDRRNVPLATLTGASYEPAELTDGSYASAETARRLACDGGIVLVGEGAAGETLSVGRKTRSLNAAIKRALLHRDKTVASPGAPTADSFTDIT